MAAKPLKVCSWDGCKAHTRSKYCARCEPKGLAKEQAARQKAIKRTDEVRGSASSRGYDGRWRRARKQFLNNNPLCKKCRVNGKYTAAIVVDHIIPHKGNYELMWDEGNWQPLCKPCHDTKTATEDR